MVSDQMPARAGEQRDQLLDQLMRCEHDVGRAITPGLLEAQGKPTVGQFLHTVVGNRRSGELATDRPRHKRPLPDPTLPRLGLREPVVDCAPYV